MVQRRARHDGVQLAGHCVPLELDLAVGGSPRGLGVDTGRLVTRCLHHGDEAAQRPASDLDYPGRHGREGGAHERPVRGQPALIGGHADRPYAARQGSRGQPEPRSRHHVTMCTRSLLSHLADKRSIPPIPRRWQPCRTQSGWHADVLFGVLPLRLPHGREGGCDVAALAGRGGSDGAAHGAIGRDVDAAAGALIRMWSTDCRGCGRVLGRDGARRRPERLGRRCLPVQRGLSPAGAGSRVQRRRGGGSRARRGTWQVTRNRDGKTPAALGPGDRVCRAGWTGLGERGAGAAAGTG
jgi:hypothetical protein